ncbi:MAG: hypothetical protein MUO26_02235 [Methanotrichaceae archaeon]|nr:hypothetical protein [Methanotrichaceae archaeon]
MGSEEKTKRVYFTSKLDSEEALEDATDELCNACMELLDEMVKKKAEQHNKSHPKTIEELNKALDNQDLCLTPTRFVQNWEISEIECPTCHKANLRMIPDEEGYADSCAGYAYICPICNEFFDEIDDE